MGAIVPAWALAAALTAAAPVADRAEPPAPAADPDSDPASTALALRERDTRMTVPVTINGAGPFRFIVDSGATRTVISRRLATLLALPAARTVTLHSIGGAREVATVHIAAMTLGGLPARPIDAPVLEAADLGGAGILGIDALAGKRVVIDMRARSMAVTPAARIRPRPGADGIVVTARRRFGQLVLADAEAAGQRVFAIVDTGSMVTIGNSALRARLVRRRRAAPVATVITDVAGQRIAAELAPIATMRLGGWRLAGVTVAFADAHAFASFGLAERPAMLLGIDLLRAFDRVAIDFRHRTVELLGTGPRPRIATAD